MSRTTPPATTPVSSQPSWGWLSLFALVALAVFALALGTQPTTWFYPGVLALVVFLAAMLLEFVVIPQTSTWQPVVSIGGTLVSLVLLLGVFTVSFAWWIPVVVAYAFLAVVALLRR